MVSQLKMWSYHVAYTEYNHHKFKTFMESILLKTVEFYNHNVNSTLVWKGEESVLEYETDNAIFSEQRHIPF